MSDALPKGLKHPGGGVPARKPMVELAYASSKFDRITRVHVTEASARFWLERIVHWPDVLRAIIRDASGVVLEDRPIEARILDAELRARCERVLERGAIMAYAHWSHA